MRRSSFGQARFVAVLLLIAAAVFWGRTQVTASQTPAEDPACVVSDDQIRQWIEQPSVPAEPAGTTDACFFNLAWQQLFAVSQRQNGVVPEFATWPTDSDLFPETGDATVWHTKAPRSEAEAMMRARLLRKSLGMPGAGGVQANQVTEAAALTPAVDQRGRWLHFSVVVNKPEYEYIRCCELYRGGCFNQMGGVATNLPGASKIHLPSGPEASASSMEVKLAWRVLETCDLPDSPRHHCKKEDASRYLTVLGEVQPYSPKFLTKPVKARLGLVGMHIVQKTERFPDSIWATFEHIDNAPDCPPAGSQAAAPPKGFSDWILYDPNCRDSKNPGRCLDNWYCPPCPKLVSNDYFKTFNTDPKKSWKICPDPKTGGGIINCTPNPNEFNLPITVNGHEVFIHLFDPLICKSDPILSQVCRSVPISADVASLNDRVRGILGQIGGSSAVLANYELVGSQWFDTPCSLHNPATCKLLPSSGTALANTTMETYLQTLPQGCTTCHSQGVESIPAKAPMQFNSGLADRSMLFHQIRQFGADCSAGQAANCGAWEKGCPAMK